MSTTCQQQNAAASQCNAHMGAGTADQQLLLVGDELHAPRLQLRHGTTAFSCCLRPPVCLSHAPLLCRLLNPLAAILISVTAILVFAEIMPQVSCVGQVRYLQQSVLAAMLSAELNAAGALYLVVLRLHRDAWLACAVCHAPALPVLWHAQALVTLL